MTSWPSSCIACCPDSLMHSPEDETRKYYFSCLNKVIEQRGTAVLNEAATGMYAGMAWDGQGRPATCFADKGTGNLRICCAMSGGVDLEKKLPARVSASVRVYPFYTCPIHLPFSKSSCVTLFSFYLLHVNPAAGYKGKEVVWRDWTWLDDASVSASAKSTY